MILKPKAVSAATCAEKEETTVSYHQQIWTMRRSCDFYGTSECLFSAVGSFREY